MTKRLLAVLCLGSLLALGACGGDEGQECGEGTVAQGDSCVPAFEEVACGPGTELVEGECVSTVEEVECGPGTELDADGACVSTVEEVECGPDTELVDGECVSTVEEIACGPDTELVDGECVSTIEEIECGEGTILIDGICDIPDPTDGLDVEADEPNDPFFDGVPGTLTLGADGETVTATGNIDEGFLFGEGDAEAVVPDFDVFIVSNDTAGRRISVEATAVGAPSVAVSVTFVPEEGDDREYVRLALPFGSRNAFKEMLLPFEGNYEVRVGTEVDLAAFFGVGGVEGDPTGATDFTWILGVTPLASKEATTFTGNATFTFEGDVREAPQAFVEADAGRIVQLTLEAGDGVAGSVNTSDAEFNGYGENVGLVVVPEGGLAISVDSIFDRDQDTSFTLTSVEQPLLELGPVAPGEAPSLEETLVGNSFQFVSFTIDTPMVVSVTAEPAEGSDANLGAVLVTPDLSEGIAGSFDQLFGFFAPPENSEFFQAFLAEPGTYLVQVFHENPDEDNGEHPYVITVEGIGVVAFDDLSALDAQTLTDDEVAVEGGETFYSVNVTELGLLNVVAGGQDPDGFLDVATQLHAEPFLAARDQIISVLTANDGFEGESEEMAFPASAGPFLVRLTNAGFDATGETADVTVSLDPINLEMEPNDTAGTANDLGTLGEEQTLLGGALALDVDTTTDFFIFNVDGISDVTLSVEGVSDTPAEGIRMSLFDVDNLNEPLATEETFIDFFTGQPIDPQIQTVLDIGQYVVSLVQIDDTETGNYLFSAVVNEVLDCVPGSTVCTDANVTVCVDGFETEEIICAANASCTEVGDFAGCGNLSEVEPNADSATASELGTLQDGRLDANGLFSEAGDADFYTFTVDSNAIVTIGTSPAGAPAPDTTLTLFDANDVEIAFNDDGFGRGLFSLIEGEPIEAGSYFVRVGTFQDAGLGPYNLSIDVVLAECDIADPAVCDGNDIVACDGFSVGVVETCGFGCVEGDEGPECVVPEFELESEPNDGVGENGLTFNDVDLPYVGFGEVTDGDVDMYFVNLPEPFKAYDVSFSTAPAGNNLDFDSIIGVCDLESVLLDGVCDLNGFGGNAIVVDDDSGEGLYSSLTATLEAGNYLFVVRPLGFGAGEYLVNIDAEVAGLEEFTEAETNDEAAEANEVFLGAGGASVRAAIDFGADQDWFQLEVTDPGTVLSFFTLPVDDGVDAQMFLCDTSDPDNCAFGFNNGNIASDDDSGGNLQPSLEFTFADPGTYFVVIQSFQIETGGYDLFILDNTP